MPTLTPKFRSVDIQPQVHFLTRPSVKVVSSVLTNFEGIPYMAVTDYAVGVSQSTNVIVMVSKMLSITTKTKEML